MTVIRFDFSQPLQPLLKFRFGDQIFLLTFLPSDAANITYLYVLTHGFKLLQTMCILVCSIVALLLCTRLVSILEVLLVGLLLTNLFQTSD